MRRSLLIPLLVAATLGAVGYAFLPVFDGDLRPVWMVRGKLRPLFFSDDGDLVYAYCSDRDTLVGFDSQTGREAVAFQPPTGWPDRRVVSPDRKTLLVAHPDPIRLCVYETATGRRLASVQALEKALPKLGNLRVFNGELCFANLGRWIICQIDDYKDHEWGLLPEPWKRSQSLLLIWDWPTNQLVKQVPIRSEEFAVSSDGQWLTYRTSNRQVEVLHPPDVSPCLVQQDRLPSTEGTCRALLGEPPGFGSITEFATRAFGEVVIANEQAEARRRAAFTLEVPKEVFRDLDFVVFSSGFTSYPHEAACSTDQRFALATRYSWSANSLVDKVLKRWRGSSEASVKMPVYDRHKGQVVGNINHGRCAVFHPVAARCAVERVPVEGWDFQHCLAMYDLDRFADSPPLWLPPVGLAMLAFAVFLYRRHRHRLTARKASTAPATETSV